MSTAAVVLAAGEGKRMHSRRPKVLHEIAGRSLVGWVIAAAHDAGVDHVVVVVGRGADEVQAALPAGVEGVVQEERRGTGHATGVGLDALPADVDQVVVMCGDAPIISGDDVAGLIAAHLEGGHAATVLTAVLEDAGAYGRVLREPDGLVAGVVEAGDADEEQLAVREVNSGLICFERAALAAALPRVDSDNAQGEIYLPDALPLLDGSVGALVAGDPGVVQGVNNRLELAACAAAIQDRLRAEAMLAGVGMPEPGAVWLEAGVSVGPDSVLHPGTHLRGSTDIGAGCQIGPDAVITDCAIGDGTSVVMAHLNESEIGAGCQIGPFAYLRPGCVIADGAKVGTYVEMKKSVLGQGAKVPHLSYIGDTEIGEGSNIGAGNITANYDGFRKHPTTIGARVKTGSDCVFVAPVVVGDDSMTAAGSILTDDVPDGALGIARARQKNIEGFTERAAARARAAAEDDG